MDRQSISPEMQIWIDQSQGLVRAIASKVSSQLPSHVNYEDLVSYGQLGLMQAAHAFQPDKDVAFQTFAYHRIRGAIYDGLSKMNWTNKAVRQRIRAERLSAELFEQQVRASQEQELDSMASDAEQIVRSTERITLVHLLSESTSEGGQGLEKIVADDDLPPDELVTQQETCELLRAAVEQLREPARTIVRSAYYEGKSLTDIAISLGKSKSWASRVHSRALEDLALFMKQHGEDRV
ncbi:MAG: sigma-70 family RNA polymerase sigma factor [Planctomycetales bacterium]|nr:sigma-70 family RNA polymerase sigma factor [Planctomycetales bacterium]